MPLAKKIAKSTVRLNWIIGFTLTLIFFLFTLIEFPGWTASIETLYFDLISSFAPPSEKNTDIELVVITDEDISALGPYPWSRDIIAQGIQNLASYGVKVIALDLFFNDAGEKSGLDALRHLMERIEASGLAQEDAGSEIYNDLLRIIERLDNDAKLKKVFKMAGNIVLPVLFESSGNAAESQISPYMERHAIKRKGGLDLQGFKAFPGRTLSAKWLVSGFEEDVAGMGHVNFVKSKDGRIRNLAPVLAYEKDRYFPSFAMAIVKLYKGVNEKNMTINPGGDLIHMKSNNSWATQVPVNNGQIRTTIKWPRTYKKTFHRTPFIKVFKNQVEPDLFRDKITIVGISASGVGNTFSTPVTDTLPEIDLVAVSVANMIDEDYYIRPQWAILFEIIILIISGFYIVWYLPGLKMGTRIPVTLGMILIYMIVGIILYLSLSIWFRVMPAILLLVTGHAIMELKAHFLDGEAIKKTNHRYFETYKVVGLAFQRLGMPDLAFEKYSRLPLEEEREKTLLYNLGLEYEQNKQLSKAMAVYDMLNEEEKTYKDLEERIFNIKSVSGFSSERIPEDFLSSQDSTSIEIISNQISKRYTIIREVGQGLTGMVYQAEDLKTQQEVALKIINLGGLEEDFPDEILERLTREIEPAFLLDHPNIVSVEDCGMENGRAYVAMELAKGVSLAHHINGNNHLPLKVYLDIIARVAEALEYAHGKGIVHGDIRPSKIIWNREDQKIKLTGFGFSRIRLDTKNHGIDTEKHRAYMSPEQVAGRKMDGRSDVFSLGAVLFELFTGQQPFSGKDLTALMYSIAKARHPSMRSTNEKIPRVVEMIVDKALEKKPDRRYPTAGQMAIHLKQVIKRIDQRLRARHLKSNVTDY